MGDALKPETLLFGLTPRSYPKPQQRPRTLPPSRASCSFLLGACWPLRSGGAFMAFMRMTAQAGFLGGGGGDKDLSQAPANWGVCKVPQRTCCAWSVPGQAGRGSILCRIPGKALAVSTGLGSRALEGGAGGGTLGCEVPHLGLIIPPTPPLGPI